ncbi:hypothetical protein T440DRAFT_465924 [Plenodomus tracheiphilus IPT5]|uniref:Uncharacterized protein n=1 Tax=Plenodomus tracheiphilus IPT5 TaxID=1408161 RepID=A0A6A7BFS3_9PLEO|nr:hypothetical protein T440DRAFT_465924 [Plenodomus tracheiphilus IPT5]
MLYWLVCPSLIGLVYKASVGRIPEQLTTMILSGWWWGMRHTGYVIAQYGAGSPLSPAVNSMNLGGRMNSKKQKAKKGRTRWEQPTKE